MNEAKLEQSPLELGNAQKMREALSKFCAYSAVVLNAGMFNEEHLKALLNMAKAALSEPPRNCDVGTADELWRRFKSYCDDNVAHNKLYCQTTCCTLCVMDWMKMPYDKE